VTAASSVTPSHQRSKRCAVLFVHNTSSLSQPGHSHLDLMNQGVRSHLPPAPMMVTQVHPHAPERAPVGVERGAAVVPRKSLLSRQD